MDTNMKKFRNHPKTAKLKSHFSQKMSEIRPGFRVPWWPHLSAKHLQLSVVT